MVWTPDFDEDIVCVDCGGEADMFTEGEYICDACDDKRADNALRFVERAALASREREQTK